jgi:surfactin synthase thioesterase subunit
VSDWFLHPDPRPDAAVRLFCVPCAGAGPATLHDWPTGLPSFVDMVGVRLSGRELRLTEEPVAAMADVMDGLTGAIDPWLDRPIALYGHSLGSSIAYELGRWLHEHRPDHRPVLLAVAAGRAPHVAPQVPLYRLADDELLLELERMGGLPAEAREVPELVELMLPTIRADLTTGCPT